MAETEEKVPFEQDTAAAEDATDLHSLLLPDGALPVHVKNFSLTYANLALQGWVKQRSPVCAACSVAGAYNAVLGLSRGMEGAQSQESVLNVLKELVEGQIRRAEDSLLRQLLVPSIQPALELVQERIAEKNKTLGGKKTAGVTPKECVCLIRRRCIEEVLEKGNVDVDPNKMPSDVFESLIEVWGITKEKCEVEPETPDDKFLSSTDDDDERMLAGSDDEEELESTVVMKKKNAKKKKGQEKDQGQAVSCALNKWFRAIIAHAKLCRDIGPSTAGIGNWGILQSTTMLAEKHDVCIGTRILFGRGCTAALKLRSSDTELDVSRQWAAVREAFDTPRTSLIFHLTNHYALIFAMRSYTNPEGVVVREILTARKGQRPSAWISFTDVRSILLSWGGYKIMQVAGSAA
eukprot:TRINITY_DN4219_c1_g2_i1.p1 TRINITY_DN4219_c1_g2~~TRINITY_DN4219_c1_g2_i1.p1  ORF type:complete len:415 (+),score=103.43 TRINITY_DN4219_c1_g2_i1:28-1245(+)